MFNGKYKQKCRKYQLVTDVVGNVVKVMPTRQQGLRHAAFDGTVFKTLGAGVHMEEWEHLCGDKAYVGICLVPPSFAR